MKPCYSKLFYFQNAANEVVLTIGQAFEVAYQKMMKARAKVTAATFERQLASEEVIMGTNSNAVM